MAYIPGYSYPNPIYKPAMRTIASITRALSCLVTTDIAHLYIIGLIVRLDIPPGFGMYQANQLVGTVLTIPTPTTFTLDIDTTYFDPLVIPTIPNPPPQIAYQSPQVVPVGEVNNLLTGAVQNTLPH